MKNWWQVFSLRLETVQGQDTSYVYTLSIDKSLEN